MRRCLSALVLATTTALLLASAALAAPGDLDPSFSEDGRVTINFGSGTGGLTDLAIQPDGKIVLVGWQFTTPPPYPADGPEADFIVMRLNPDGTPDLGFGSGGSGSVVLDIPLNTLRSYNIANTVELQPDGKILVGGYSRKLGATGESATIVRLQPSGLLDTSFNGNAGSDSRPGIAVDRLGRVNDLELDSQGRILAGGTWDRVPPLDAQVFLQRYSATGTREDQGYDGPVFGWGTGTRDGLSQMALQSDQRVVMVGFSFTSTVFDGAVARANPNGGLDASFSGDGLFTYNLGTNSVDASEGVALQPDGKIDVAGYGTTGDDFTLTRLTSGGELDDSLGGKSTVSADFGGEDAALAIELQANGKMLLGGSGPTDMGFVRFQPGGAPDDTFGPNGKRVVSFPGATSSVNRMALQADGKIIAVGTTRATGATGFSGAVVRLQGDTKADGGAPSGPSGGKSKAYRCGGKRATIVGTNKKNKLKGTRRADVIVGLGGNDTISGLGGNDIVCGGSGNDKVKGGSGNDKLYGDAGKDSLAGEAGNDRESGGSGNDKVSGGSGNDNLSGGSGKDNLSGGSGKDKLNGNSGKDKLNGGPGKDACAGRDKESSC